MASLIGYGGLLWMAMFVRCFATADVENEFFWKVGEQPGVTGAPQGVQQAGGQSMVSGEPQGVQQGGGQGVQQAGGQPRVLGAPQGEQQIGGQPGVTGAPQGVQKPGGQPRVPWAPQGAQQSGGRSMDNQEQQLEEWCRLLELDTPMATVEESEADEAPPMPPPPCPRFPCDTCFHTFATRGGAANHMRVCRAAEAERRAQALSSIPSLVETDTQERSTPREFGEEAWAGVTSWEWETFFSVEAVGGRTVRRIPQRARSGVLDALCCILKRLKSQPGDEAATLLLLTFPRLILAMPPKPGIGQKALITERLNAFWEGRWRELFDSAMVAARPAVRPLSYTCSDQDPDAIRLSRCRSRCEVGEWSRGLACLTAGELARPSEVMVQSLREKHPASAGEVPQWVRDFTIDTAQRPSLTTDILARAIHTAARASAAGPSGWVTEHLRDTFLTEPSCLSHLLEVFNQWVAGQVPERARPWLAASNLVGLSKPNGDVWPVAIGEVLPRILARALCISLRPALVSYFLPCNQLGAGTRSLESARGSRQGDPLGPFLFAFTQQQVMELVTREFKDLLFLSYADDTYILGPAARILEAFGVLRERLEWVGLEVQAHKCRFWEREGKEVERALPLGMQRVDEGLTVVGVPIGEEVWEIFLEHRDFAMLRTIGASSAALRRGASSAAAQCGGAGLASTIPSLPISPCHSRAALALVALSRSLASLHSPPVAPQIPLPQQPQNSSPTLTPASQQQHSQSVQQRRSLHSPASLLSAPAFRLPVSPLHSAPRAPFSSSADSSADPTEQRSPPTERVVRLADEIVGLTLLEVSDLTTLIRKKLGMEDAPMGGMPMGMMMMPGGAMPGGGGGGEAAPAAAVEEKTAFDVKLEGFDAAAKLKVIKEVRSIAGLGLKEAKEFVEKAPVVVKAGVSKEDAAAIAEKLKAVGATVVVE
ncbi:unnamed protein product [Closterium sp. NIES-64]|nr:unnamed protein product [Closterium sp. NIES-64]